jgi:predicted lipoprotein with Yx(FWY)xxD motif
MRTNLVMLLACALPTLLASPGLGDEKTPAKLDHPGNVALIHDEAGWTYVHFPTNLRLYIYDKDSNGKSSCNLGCDGAWPPLQVAGDDKPLGDWTIATRYDGTKQWVYKGRPVYLRFHDSPEKPTGDGLDGSWHYLQP